MKHYFHWLLVSVLPISLRAFFVPHHHEVLFQQTQAARYTGTVLSAIDEAAVADAVKFLPIPPPPPPTRSSVAASSVATEVQVDPITIAVGILGTFAIGTFIMRVDREKESLTESNIESKATTQSAVTKIDVTVPYDSAALLAYDEWRSQYGKGSFDEGKFEVFKSNYYTMTVANVIAKKVARISGEPAILTSLDVDADSKVIVDTPSLPTASTDVSIPYDAAALLAYDEWRLKFDKGDFDAIKFEKFKQNYETITVANVVAKKLSRSLKTTGPTTLMSLDETADQ